MADVPVGAVPAPAAPTAPAVVRRAPSAVRAEKLAAVSAGLAKLDTEAGASPASAAAAKPPGGLAAPAAAAAPKEPGAGDKPAEKPAADEPDDKTAKGIAAIDRRAAKFREEQSAAKTQIDLERAELARMRAEVSGKSASFEELQKLAKRDPIAALAKLGIDSEDDWENVGRGAYPRTKAGKADPRAQPAVAQSARERELADKIAELDAKIAKVDETITSRDRQAQSQRYIATYLDSAVKAIPTTPSLIGKLHGKSPEKARQALLETGQRMERQAMAAEGATQYDPSFTPGHTELVAEYERARRAELEEQGVDVDALLAPPKPATEPAKKPAATLDPTSTTGTQPVAAGPAPTRAEKIKAVTAGLKKFEAEQQN